MMEGFEEFSNTLTSQQFKPGNLLGTQTQELQQELEYQVVVVSMGPDGAWLVTNEEKHFVKAPKVQKNSTVGAGDSMVAGITYALQKNLSLREALQWGVACGSAATMGHGTQLFKREDVERLLGEMA